MLSCTETVDPIRDMDTIEGELIAKDLARVTNAVDSMRKNVERKLGGREKKEEFVSTVLMVQRIQKFIAWWCRTPSARFKKFCKRMATLGGLSGPPVR